MNDEQSLAVLLRRLARGVTRLERDEICCAEVTLQQYETLRHLLRLQAASTGELAALQNVDVSTMSRNLTVLERTGYVCKTRDRKDARSVRNKLSRKGLQLLASLQCDERSVFAKVYDRIPREQRSAVSEALQVLVAAIESDEKTSACCAPGGECAG